MTMAKSKTGAPVLDDVFESQVDVGPTAPKNQVTGIASNGGHALWSGICMVDLAFAGGEGSVAVEVLRRTGDLDVVVRL